MGRSSDLACFARYLTQGPGKEDGYLEILNCYFVMRLEALKESKSDL